MAETTEAAADPSMEEILASIRKIISDDVPSEAAAEPAPAEDIIELTQMVEEDGSVTDLSAATPEAPVQAEVSAPAQAPKPSQTASSTTAPSPTTESLVADTVANTMASKLSSLANTVEIERLSSAPATATLIGNGHRTLEDMVIELMRPLLKDWLDQNLPAVVDRLVQKEIERIARRS